MTELQLTHRASDLWTVDHPFKTLGAHVGTRTTVIRLASGGLWLLCPGPGLEQLQTQIEALGPVEALVAPNSMHHLYLPTTARLFATARIYGPPALKAKQPELSYTLIEQAPWADELPAVQLRGLGPLQESAFYHPPSRTLIVTDLVFNIQHAKDTWTRLFMTLNDGNGKFGPTRILRSVLKDRQALAAALEKILAWDFERVIMAHGEVIETGGKAQMREAFARIGVLQPSMAS